jgi:hypothetical protein
VDLTILKGLLHRAMFTFFLPFLPTFEAESIGSEAKFVLEKIVGHDDLILPVDSDNIVGNAFQECFKIPL